MGETVGTLKRKRRALAIAAGVAGVVVDAIYLRVIQDQGTGFGARTMFVAGYIAAMAVLALVSVLGRDPDARGSQIALLASACGFFALGIVGLWSIGFALLFIGMIVLVAALPVRVRGAWAAAAIVAPILIVAAGITWTPY